LDKPHPAVPLEVYTVYNNNYFTALYQYYPGEPVPEDTFTHSHLSWLSIILYQLPPSITIHGSLAVQFTCMTVFLHNLAPCPVSSTLGAYAAYIIGNVKM